ncbi:MAG: phosphoribosylformylglycinamidine cyclo-ligase [Myxococcota bacterium]
MPAGGLTYKDSGVDADLGDTLVERIGARAKRTHRPGVVSGIGGFASMFSLKEALEAAKKRGLPVENLDDPLIVSGTDGVGTKLKLAFDLKQHGTVGIDLVAMCVNDVLTTGALPLFFLDYYGTGKLEIEVAAAVIAGISEGCEQAEMALVGGETAELPGLYHPGEYDLAGFAVGVVDRKDVIDGRTVVPGDVLLGVASSGLHSNGYSLARKALLDRGGLSLSARIDALGETLGEALLRPTIIYAKVISALLRAARPKALAHITGGGIPGNLPRVLPPGTRAILDRGSWRRAPIFDLIQKTGGIEEGEMERTFNLGLGLIAAVAPAQAEAALAAIRGAGGTASVVGRIEAHPTPGAEADAILEGTR